MSPLVLKVPMIVTDFVNESPDNDRDFETFDYQVIGYYFFNPMEIITIHKSEMMLNGEMTPYTVIQLKGEETVRIAMTPEDFLRMIIQSFSDRDGLLSIDKSVLN